ncbi:outer membrane lipoprotein-sorting protein [Marivita sp. GX14005]|uniref:outer membrane lipoprotein-sorting protein n=1 Tax=Marivita sp. GX14005 TaxID=2942276 RepID=UPI00201A1865|nr:outer membrane lipoprotein-sorting protein [Marivita sp. GX14005]MCL3883035.1 outer membrane lipoprotein-sorting protein [Marivita sp. GX14005]
MTYTPSRRFILAAGIAALVAPRIALAGPADAMHKSRELRRGLTNSMADVTMTITAQGRASVRKMRQYVLETPNSGNQTINVFSSPADVQGVSILTHSALNGDDRQWLFLPSVGRVKRISSSNRSGAFVGSDFAYEDLSSLELEKYEFTAAGTSAVGGVNAIEVTYTPRYSGTGYSAIRSYLDPSHYQPIQNHYFNRRGEHMKTLHLGGYKSYGGGAIWRPHHLVMTDHAKGSTTEIVFSAFRSNGTAAANFSANRFERVS